MFQIVITEDISDHFVINPKSSALITQFSCLWLAYFHCDFVKTDIFFEELLYFSF